MANLMRLAPNSYFHEDTGSVRFWVRCEDGSFIGASVRKETLHYGYNAPLGGAVEALAAYRAHQDELEAAVMRRVAQGSIEPVMLREADLTTSAGR
jgi:hypothetical protein